MAAPLPCAVGSALDIQTLTWMPRHSEPGPYHWDPKAVFLKLLLEKETTFQLALAKEIPLSILL